MVDLTPAASAVLADEGEEEDEEAEAEEEEEEDEAEEEEEEEEEAELEEEEDEEEEAVDDAVSASFTFARTTLGSTFCSNRAAAPANSIDT